MMHFIKNKKSGSGFTLIELLVVIAIIGVLATVVLASLNTARRKSRDARRVTDLKQIQLALELYFDGVGANQYPAANTTCDTTDSNGLRVLVTNGYIASIPRDPSSVSTCYRYASASINNLITFYHLGAVLEDSTNSALNSDKDCNDNTSGSCLPATPTPTWAGTRIQGINSTDCTAAAGTSDQCYDVTP